MNRHRKRSKGEFEFSELVGQGGFGEIYKAYDTVDQKVVAIKQLYHHGDLSKLERIDREIEIHSKLNHPKIVQYYGFFSDQVSKSIIMEFCPNKTVTDREELKRGSPIPLFEAKEYARDLAEAVDYLHDKCVVHRDLKPGNMLLDKNGTAKLCDFGLSTNVVQLKASGNSICGTLNFMPPEIYERRAVTRACDIWSYGVVMYTMLVGKPPFMSDMPQETVQKSQSVSYSIPSWVDPKAADLLFQCLKKDQKQRPSMKQILSHPFFSSKTNIEPLKCPLKNGHVQINDDGCIILDMYQHDTIVKVNTNREVDIINRNNPRDFKRFSIKNLPEKFKKRCEMALKIAEESQKMRPMVIWNSYGGKYILFCDLNVSQLFNGKLYPVSADKIPHIFKAMMSIVESVKESGEPRWPAIIGSSKQCL